MPGRANPADELAGNTNANTGTNTYGPGQQDAQGRSYVDWPDGTRFYLRPQAGSPLYFQGSNGGRVHNPDNWNPRTGQWESGGVNWSALGSWLGLAAIGGVVAAPAIAAAVSSSVPPAVAAETGISSAGTATGAGAAATGAGAASGASAGAGTLAATQTVPVTGALAAGVPSSGAVAAATGSGVGTAGTMGSLLQRYGPAAARAVGAATNAAGNNRISNDQLDLEGRRTDISGRQAYENQLLNRSNLESTQRHQALADVYRAGWYQNRQAGPNNTRGLPGQSQAFMDALASQSAQGQTRLASGPQYGTNQFAPLEPYTPFSRTPQGRGERIGNWVSPILSILGSYAGGR